MTAPRDSYRPWVRALMAAVAVTVFLLYPVLVAVWAIASAIWQHL